jgi:hypothetical protein
VKALAAQLSGVGLILELEAVALEVTAGVTAGPQQAALIEKHKE